MVAWHTNKAHLCDPCVVELPSRSGPVDAGTVNIYLSLTPPAEWGTLGGA